MYRTKVCTKCNTVKSIFDFHKSNKTKDGLKYHCKKCRKKQESYRYQQNKEIIKKNVNNYRKRYRMKILLKKIKQRCNNKKTDNYRYYGGKGIKCLITEKELKKTLV